MQSDEQAKIRLTIYGFMDEFSILRKIKKLSKTEKNITMSMGEKKRSNKGVLILKFIDPSSCDIEPSKLVTKMKHLLSSVREIQFLIKISESIFDNGSWADPETIRNY